MIEQYSVPRNQTVPKTQLAVDIHPGSVAKLLTVVAGLLFFMNAIGIYLKIVRKVESDTVNTLFAFFDLNTEANVPTFFSSFLLLFASVLLFVIAWQMNQSRSTVQNVKYWRFLGFCFLFLAVDEAVEFHEWLGLMTKVVLAYNFTGIFYYAWIIPYLLLLLIGFLFIRNFLFGLPPRTRNLFILSAVLFVGGAIGLEMLEARHDDTHPTFGSPQTLYFAFLYSIEEVLEMIGVTLFIYALLDFMAARRNVLELRLGSSG